MTTAKQRTAARTNIRKAQAAWAAMSSRQHAAAQPEGRARKKPGAGGEGNYYHVEVRRSEDFATFRTQDVGEPGHIQRVAGKRGSGKRRCYFCVTKNEFVDSGRAGRPER